MGGALRLSEQRPLECCLTTVGLTFYDNRFYIYRSSSNKILLFFLTQCTVEISFFYCQSVLFGRFLIEFPATGGAIPTSAFRTVKLIRYVTVMDYVIMACECIFVLFCIYYTVEEAIEVSSITAILTTNFKRTVYH